MSTISLTTFALFSFLVIPSFPFYKSFHLLNLIPLNGPFVKLLFIKLIFPSPFPHCIIKNPFFFGFFLFIFLIKIAFFFFFMFYFFIGHTIFPFLQINTSFEPYSVKWPVY